MINSVDHYQTVPEKQTVKDLNCLLIRKSGQGLYCLHMYFNMLQVKS